MNLYLSPSHLSWHSVHCYIPFSVYSPSADSQVLAICTALEQSFERHLGRRPKLFFVRYRDDRDHIRLRFLVDGENDPRGVIDIHNDLSEVLAESNVSVVTQPYVREVERYGGPSLIEPAERLFVSSSSYARRILTLMGDAHESRAALLILSQSCMALAFSSCENDARKLLDAHSSGYLSNYSQQVASSALKRTERYFELIGDMLREALLAIRTGTIEDDHYRPFIDECQTYATSVRIVAGNEMSRTMRSLQSQLHMTANRLGASIYEEAVCAAVAARLIAV